MQETGVVLGIDDQALQEEVMHFLERLPTANVVGAAEAPNALRRLVRATRPNVVIGVPELLEGIEEPIRLAIAVRETTGGLRAALRAGARAFFLWPDERQALAREIKRSRPREATEPSEAGIVIGVLGARGGAGVTFIATHLAAALASSGAETVLADLDVLQADVAPALGMNPDTPHRSVSDLMAVSRELSVEHLDPVLHQHAAGFRVLFAPQEVPAEASLDGRMVRSAVQALRERFQATVLHLPRTVDRSTRSAMELADEVLLVVTLDVLGIRAAKRMVDHLRALGLGDSFRLIVNRAGRAELVPEDIRRVLDVPLASVIGVDRAVHRAQNRGELIAGRRGQVPRRIARLARELLEGRAA
jgi:pilus assembly protein CpaE